MGGLWEETVSRGNVFFRYLCGDDFDTILTPKNGDFEAGKLLI